ncbi:MAG: nucleotide exchange factor GrpE [Gammaproteobacteria bacterium]|nr:MAG: nucleotide exchange factor GrpE [Gammaproteobacteria bacterium]
MNPDENKAVDEVQQDVDQAPVEEGVSESGEVEVKAEEGAIEENSADSSAPVDTELQAEIARYKDQVIRLQAEMENVRRRSEMDVEKAHKFALERFVKELLPVVDSLEKAIEMASGDDEALASMRQGIELTLNMFISALGKFKVEQIDPVGEPFDPQFHEAMSMVDAPDAEPNSVVAVMQKGYCLNGRLVRPAMVMVSRAPSGSKVDETA